MWNFSLSFYRCFVVAAVVVVGCEYCVMSDVNRVSEK